MKPMFSPGNFRFLLSVSAMMAFVSSSALAQTWNGGGDGVSWSDPANWAGGLPNVDTQTRFLTGSLPDAPLVIVVDGTTAPFKNVNFAIGGNRTLTIQGGTLYLETTPSSATIQWNSSFENPAPVIINSDIVYTSVESGSAIFSINPGGRTITFNGNITPTGEGGRQMTLSGAGVIVINGSNGASNLSFTMSGELIVGNLHALGAGQISRSGSGGILSLRSDVIVANNGSYSWLHSGTSYFRISEENFSTVDRTITMTGRLAANQNSPEATIEFLENVNSSGNLILDLKYSGGTVQSVHLVTNDNTIVRFSQTGNTTYTGLIGGSGRVEKVVGTGTTTFTQANTYTGETLIGAGTLALGADGGIANSSHIILGTASTLGTLDVSAKSSFAFGEAQKVSGRGTIRIGEGKTITVAGELAPGAEGAGQINVTGNLTLGNTATTTMKLAGLGGVAGADFDNVTVSGDLLYNGTLSIVMSGALDTGEGTSFNLFDFASRSGNFDAVTFNGNALVYDGGLWSGAHGNYVYSFTLDTGVFTITTVIPEPGAALLLLLGAGVMPLYRRRNRKGV